MKASKKNQLQSYPYSQERTVTNENAGLLEKKLGIFEKYARATSRSLSTRASKNISSYVSTPSRRVQIFELLIWASAKKSHERAPHRANAPSFFWFVRYYQHRYAGRGLRRELVTMAGIKHVRSNVWSRPIMQKHSRWIWFTSSDSTHYRAWRKNTRIWTFSLSWRPGTEFLNIYNYWSKILKSRWLYDISQTTG